MNFKSLLIAVMALLMLVSCEEPPPFHERPEVKSQIIEWESKGWTFVAVVGEPTGSIETSEARHSDEKGYLHIAASNLGFDGDGHRAEQFEREFQSAGYEFMAVNNMKTPASNYSVVFRRKTTEQVPSPDFRK